MKTIITYITDDGKEFNDIFQARRHECELTEHKWEFYGQNMVVQKELSKDSKLRFCKVCSKQETI